MSYSPNHSLAKAFAILEALNGAQKGLTASEVAGHTGLPVSTTHRFLQNLGRLGYVVLDPGRKLYTIGFSLTLFGNRRLIIRRIVNRAEPFLHELASQSGLAAYLGYLDGPHAVIEQRALPLRASKGTHAVGARLDAHAHSIGKALLSLLPRAELMRIYDAERLRVHTGRTIGRRDHLLREMADVVVRGYAIDNEELSPGCGVSPAPCSTQKAAQFARSHSRGRGTSLGRTRSARCCRSCSRPAARSWNVSDSR
ncbi:IclR family transcriptional regulator [Rhodoplanes sp. Z2-YC6860]|uniref:IclR family transcriptional regulator n=1 Tax=Rhodoplanes sp. Z2-YC6860 TaxID=674703 RepID=UPI00078BAB1A|nr:IclR family transcriptional regulator [Rhodoplanes sp. Z2-YC6860]AMN41508.1 IclR family transcriptional regulator [Rhodoplanes sp. Z2-YC6860]